MAKLGFVIEDDCLYLTTENYTTLSDIQIQFHIEKAKEFAASAVYLRKQLNGSYKPQVYLFDFTHIPFTEEKELNISEIQTKIWSSGEAPLACFFYKTEIKIVDCTCHLTKDYKPQYLIEQLALTAKANQLYNDQFAIKIKSGIFWEEKELKNKFKFGNSAYDTLIKNIHFVINKLKEQFVDTTPQLANKIIIQAILIKYLEERMDNNGNKLLSDKYFQPYGVTSFNEVLRQKGKFADLLSDLDKHFNGNVFKWKEEEQEELRRLDLSIVAQLLNTDKKDLSSQQLEFGFTNWRYFEFSFIPVELISRLYEEFLGEQKKEKGLFYTPSHLAKLLVDECLPLKNYEDFDIANYKILDPACGSGIFLVVVFKRLVQIWKLQHDMATPTITDLKLLLKNIYGVDKEQQAIYLTSFSLSLALCNELNPITILNELRFDNLIGSNLIHSDFFACKEIENKKFDLVIGNPPFVTGSLAKELEKWEIKNEKIDIPQKQIALKFLVESFNYLKKDGLSCLIIKSSGLLYNSTSDDFKKMLFENYDIIQIFDFTPLARNHSLWENADVAAAAIFTKNQAPDIRKNILHLTFRRTKATIERIVFEIDDYDLHFINRQTAIANPFIWKNNLLGGGRIRTLVEKVQNFPLFEKYLAERDCYAEEGVIVGKSGNKEASHLQNIPFLPTEEIKEHYIDYNKLTKFSWKKVVKLSRETLFRAPNIILWENIGEERLPIFYNQIDFSFRHQIIGVKGTDKELKDIVANMNLYSDFYRFYIFVTSGYLLINRNTSILKNDYMQLRYINENVEDYFSDFDRNVISDVNNYFQLMLRNGENSKALQPIAKKELQSVLLHYGMEFSRALNAIYGNEERQFRLVQVVQLKNSFIATVFKYDNLTNPVEFVNENAINIEELSNEKLSAHLSANRIVKLYPEKDMIVFVKPNQYRYWLSLTAYRDADKCFSDLINTGY
ncbi:class I SAM-dependent DNA methyltransferase [Capnocytophaga leadbetteri]